MAIPYQTQILIDSDGFNPRHRSEYGFADESLGSIYSGDTIALIVPIKEGKFFIPTIAVDEVAKSLLAMHSVASLNKTYIMPLTVSLVDTKRTSTSIIRALLRSNAVKLKVVRTQSTAYIGGTGLIMKEDFTPMMMWGYTGEIIPSLDVISISEPTVYVNPDLYNSTDTVSKYLIRSVLPYLTSAETIIHSGGVHSGKIDNKSGVHSIRIVIEDFSHMFYLPPAPTSVNYSEEIGNKLANDYRGILQGVDLSNRQKGVNRSDG